jgi:hypothetical protein
VKSLLNLMTEKFAMHRSENPSSKPKKCVILHHPLVGKKQNLITMRLLLGVRLSKTNRRGRTAS